MSRPIARVLTVLGAVAALGAPVAAAGPAGATPARSVYYRGSDVAFHTFGRVAGYPGNAHAVYLILENDQDGTRVVDGWVWDFQCEPGQSINGLGYGDEDESDCTMLRALDVEPGTAVLHQQTDKVNGSRVTGSVDLVETTGALLRHEPLDVRVAATTPVTASDDWVDAQHRDIVRTYRRSATAAGSFGAMRFTGTPREQVVADIWRAVFIGR